MRKVIGIFSCVLLVFGVNGCGGGSSSSTATYNYFQSKSQVFTQTSGKVVAAYLPTYEIDGGYDVSKLPSSNLTHLIYAFLSLCGQEQNTSDATVCTSKAAGELAVDTTTIDSVQYPQIVSIKQASPSLKILLSIGGGANSNPFYAIANDATQRATFVSSVVSYLTAHTAFDGVDIDWESPTDNFGAQSIQLGSASDSQAYVDLLHDLKTALDQLGGSNGHSYLITSAINTSSYLVSATDYVTAQQYVDYFFAMTYDYFGSWSSTVGHHTPLYPATSTMGIQTLLSAGVQASKLVHGVAMYSRGWGSCTNPTNPMQGTGVATYNGGDGTELYTALATQYIDQTGKGINGFDVHYDASLHAFYLWNPTSLVFIGYDDPRAVAEKAKFAVDNHLAGVFAWELGQDNGDILNAMNYGVGNTPH